MTIVAIKERVTTAQIREQCYWSNTLGYQLMTQRVAKAVKPLAWIKVGPQMAFKLLIEPPWRVSVARERVFYSLLMLKFS